jgi:hypothetical protein
LDELVATSESLTLPQAKPPVAYQRLSLRIAPPRARSGGLLAFSQSNSYDVGGREPGPIRDVPRVAAPGSGSSQRFRHAYSCLMTRTVISI